MGLLSLFTLAVGLSMDAFAVAVCKGLAMKKITFKQMAVAGLWFGGFQAVMPVFGYLLGSSFSNVADSFADWTAFILLVIIGTNMIKEGLAEKKEQTDSGLSFKNMFVLSIASSIDAFAVGISFAFLKTDIMAASVCIGIVTFVLSAAGVKAGSIFGAKYMSKAEITGGVILIFIGIKIVAKKFF